MPLSFALPGNGRYRTNRERQRPRWLRFEYLRAEEDLGVPEKAVQSEGLSLTTKKTNFQARKGSSFAGEFCSWPYSFLFAKFEVHKCKAPGQPAMTG